ncbi:MAG TPA: rhomboid family intramembrane serine protease, partial [Phycisphaerales bacterium]|nr:rhomboid family intramembrane serine protease [Phycisphaerales bacterium]
MEILIVLNMLIYLAGLAGDVFGGVSFETLTNWMMLSRGEFHWWNLLTYQFAHNPSDILHLVFNMIGLWIFGTSLEDRLGHASFLGFYLIGGCIAGIAHMMETAAPVIGASGSVCALIGGFIALFPR